MQKDHSNSLKNFNSFAVDAYAEQVYSLQLKSELPQLLELIDSFDRVLILGSGSNVLFVDDFTGMVVVNKLKGRQLVDEAINTVTIKVAAGENWHDFVRWTLANNYYGLENLSLIPGTLGAAPIQNIGAYGVELDQYFDSLEAIDLNTGEEIVFNKADCQFSYRESIFKAQLDRYLITSVTLTSEVKIWNSGVKLCRNQRKIRRVRCQMQLNPTGLQIGDAICAIRNSKLPLPDRVGNAGSFFKNPTASNEGYAILKSNYQDIPAYKLSDNSYKLSAAWLIEQSGWKGYRQGDVGVYENHALVLVNYGGGTGQQLWQLANSIETSVADKFGIELEPEPRIIHES